MAQSISGSISTTPNFTYTNTLDLETVSSRTASGASRSVTYANGTGANQIQHVWSDERTLTTTATEDIDLSALAAGAFGTIAFTKIKEIIITVSTATTGYRLLVGGASSNAFSAFVADASDIIYIGAGGMLHISNPVDGYTVDSTHKVLKIDNPSGGSVTYKIIIGGLGSVS